MTSPAAVIQAEGLLARIGQTPLLRLERLSPPGVEIWAKAESFNPGGSVKDRAARGIVRRALEKGQLQAGRVTGGKTLLDATSGNTGVAYAMLGAALGFPVTLVMPGNVSLERKTIVAAYGAEVVLTDPLEGADGAIREASRRARGAPERYFYADQYSNPANWQAHYESTAPEIVRDAPWPIDAFAAGLGTTGTFVGVGRYLREHSPYTRLVAVEPADELEIIEGLKHLQTSIQPPIWDPALPDETLYIGAGRAWELARRLAREEGLLVGISSGAALAAALELAARPGGPQRIVTVFPDGGDRYVSLFAAQAKQP